MDLQDRMFRDSPLAQDYLHYVQEQLQNGAGLKEIEPPETFFLRKTGGDPKEADLLRAEGTDPRYQAISRIYGLLKGMP